MEFGCRGTFGPGAELKPSSVSSLFQLCTPRTSLYSTCRWVHSSEVLKLPKDPPPMHARNKSAHIGDGL